MAVRVARVGGRVTGTRCGTRCGTGQRHHSWFYCRLTLLDGLEAGPHLHQVVSPHRIVHVEPAFDPLLVPLSGPDLDGWNTDRGGVALIKGAAGHGDAV